MKEDTLSSAPMAHGTFLHTIIAGHLDKGVFVYIEDTYR